MTYLWKALRFSKYGGVDVVGFKEAPAHSVLAGQTLTCFIDNYPDAEAARAAHPDTAEGFTSKWTSPQVTLDHLPDENTPVAGGMYPDDMDTVPMTAMRRMNEIESLQSRNQALTARVRQLESELARLQSWAEGLNAEGNEMMFAIQGAMPWMILLGDYIGNGTKDDPMGRCNAILVMHKALGRDEEETPDWDDGDGY